MHMISLTKLLLDEKNYGDRLRYQKNSKMTIPWDIQRIWAGCCMEFTRLCNLRCVHCYSNAINGHNPEELSTEEAEIFIDNLEEFKVPVLLFSGGEPLTRNDIFHLIDYTKSKGIRPVISTNGTLITKDIAQTIKNSGVSYVGISLDGVGENNDQFRGVQRSF